jgi:glutamate synthase (NADPH/NADH) large chain
MRSAIDHWKAKGLDFSASSPSPRSAPNVGAYNCDRQDHGLDKALDNKLIEQAEPALRRGEPVRIETEDQELQPHRRHHALGRGRRALRP